MLQHILTEILIVSWCTSTRMQSSPSKILQSYSYESLYVFFILVALWPNVSYCLLTDEFSVTQNGATHSVGLLWTNDQLVAETPTQQHTTIATDINTCPQRDSKQQTQQRIARIPMH